jgi:lysophospholipase L1-like esterase
MTVQLITLGDSLAYGTGDEMPEGIAGRIEHIFRERGVSDARVTNLGVKGSQTRELQARLEQQRVRKSVAEADAVVLSIGANDLRAPSQRQRALQQPLLVAEEILGRIVEIVGELRRINRKAQIFILGAYNPVPGHAATPMIGKYVGMWDDAVAAQFEDDDRISVVRISDLVTPKRLSRYDGFHPGGAAYQAIADRIADMFLD